MGLDLEIRWEYRLMPITTPLSLAIYYGFSERCELRFSHLWRRTRTQGGLRRGRQEKIYNKLLQLLVLVP